jgi:hypothetical protein
MFSLRENVDIEFRWDKSCSEGGLLEIMNLQISKGEAI